MAFAIGLVRLYLRWQGKGTFISRAEEIAAFQAWLNDHHPDVPAEPGQVAALVQYQSERGQRGSKTAGRREPRQREQIQVLVSSAENSATRRARTLDVGVHGMRLESPSPLPVDEVFSLMVAPSGFPIAIYHLEGEPRWSESGSGGHIVGVRVRESGDFEKWRMRFETESDDQDAAQKS